MSDDPRHSLGRRGEQLAAEHLERLGYRVVARNYRTRFGELDLVATDEYVLVFCEVKTRRAGAGDPWWNLGEAKRRQVRSMGASLARRGPRTAPHLRAAVRRDRDPSSTATEPSSASTTSKERSDEPRPGHGLRPGRRRLPPGLGGGGHPRRPAGLHDRRARGQGGPGGARARSLRDHELGLRVPAEAHHDQPRARVPAEDRAGLRPPARDGHPRGERPGRARAGGGLRVRRRAVADRRGAADPRGAGGRAGHPRARPRADRRARGPGARGGARRGDRGRRA